MQSSEGSPPLTKKIYWSIREALRNSLKNHFVDGSRKISIRGKEIKIGFSNALEGYRIASYESKEPETLDWIDKYFNSHSVLFDIGANIGLYSVYASKKNNEGKIFSFEPVAANYSRILNNVSMNQANNVTPLMLALSDTTKLDKIYLSSLDASAALHSFGQSTDKNWSQACLGFSVDHLVQVFKIPQPTMVKIDVDGLENQILHGAKETLTNPACKSILIEVLIDNQGHSETMKILNNYGFQVEEKSKWVCKTVDGSLQNYIFKKS